MPPGDYQESDAPHLMSINAAFNPSRVKARRAQIDQALDPTNELTLPQRVDLVGLLDQVESSVRARYEAWFGMTQYWDEAAIDTLLDLLGTAVDDKKRVTFLYTSKAAGTIDVQQLEFPLDPMHILIVGPHA